MTPVIIKKPRAEKDLLDHYVYIGENNQQKFKNYIIFYRPLEDGIEVLHVFHARRDVRAILETEDSDE